MILGYYHPGTFEYHEKEIPDDQCEIIDRLHTKALIAFNGDSLITNIMVHPYEDWLLFGIMFNNDRNKKYRIIIEKLDNDDPV